MSLSENLSSAADYARRLFEKAGELLLLFILSIIPIVNILTLGYFGRVISDKADSRQPPKMERYTDMFVNGLKGLVAGIIWAIPVIIVAIITVIAVFAPIAIVASQSVWGNFTNPTLWQNFNATNWGQFLGQNPVATAIVLALIPTIIIISLASIVVGIFAFMGIVHMYKTGSFAKAFAFGEIRAIISKIGWLRYLGYIVVAVILTFIVSIFNSIPLVGWLISAFLVLVLYIFLARTIGLLYDNAVKGSPVVSQTPSVATGAASPSVQVKTLPSSIFCTNCGAPNPADAVYCNKCGKPITK